MALAVAPFLTRLYLPEDSGVVSSLSVHLRLSVWRVWPGVTRSRSCFRSRTTSVCCACTGGTGARGTTSLVVALVVVLIQQSQPLAGATATLRGHIRIVPDQPVWWGVPGGESSGVASEGLSGSRGGEGTSNLWSGGRPSGPRRHAPRRCIRASGRGRDGSIERAASLITLALGVCTSRLCVA